MKSDTDFANPYEKELDAQESKIKELTATIKELNQWYEDEHDRRVKLEEKLKEAINGTVLKRYNTEKEDALEKLKIAVEAFNKIDKANDCMKYFNNDIHVIIYETREALEAIKETESERLAQLSTKPRC